MKQHFQQIDIVKGLAIIAVLLLHSLSRQELVQSFAVFHIWQAVPLFMVVMGLNLGLSFSSSTLQFHQLYTPHYFQKKGLRILLPLLLLYGIALLAGFFWQKLYGENVYTLGWENFIGVVPVSGKGNYFITLLLQSVVMLPIIGYGFNRWPLLTSLLLILLEAVFLLLSFRIAYFDTERYLYDAAFFRYLSAIALGMWLATIISSEQTRSKWLLIVLGLASGLYLYFQQYHNLLLPHIRPEWQAQLALTFPYSALLVYLCFQLFPQQSESKALGALAMLGKASYHIFLVQVLYFGLFPESESPLLNVALCLLLGLVFYIAEIALLKFNSKS